jgi:hypothetical protein
VFFFLTFLSLLTFKGGGEGKIYRRLKQEGKILIFFLDYNLNEIRRALKIKGTEKWERD